MTGVRMLKPLRWLFRQDDYRRVFGTDAGERVKADLYEFCGMGRSSFTAGDDALTAAFNEGKRAVGLHVARQLHDEPEQVRRAAYAEEAEGNEQQQAWG